MKKTIEAVSAIHASAFSLFYVINEILDAYFYTWLESALPMQWLRILIASGISAFLYAAIYFLCRTCYKVYKFKIKSPEMNLDGVWYHVHVPTEYNHEKEEDEVVWRDFLRAGQTDIKQNLFSLQFSACNYKVSPDVLEANGLHWLTNNKVKTQWNYRCVSFLETVENGIKETKIYACYSAHSGNTDIHKGIKIDAERLGVHDLKIVEKGLIEGEYLDTFPSNKKGKILFFQDQKRRDEYIKNYFLNAKNAQASEKEA